MSDPTADELATDLAQRVWERFDIDLNDLAPWTDDWAEDRPDLYEALLVAFYSHLATPTALRAAADLADARLADSPDLPIDVRAARAMGRNPAMFEARMEVRNLVQAGDLEAAESALQAMLAAEAGR